jgi:hypothetical protein
VLVKDRQSRVSKAYFMFIQYTCNSASFTEKAVSYVEAYVEYTVRFKTQSRQSAKRFSSRWNWDSPTPLAAGECAPPHPSVRGGGHTRLRLKGWGSPISNEGTYTVVLYIYKYFVIQKIVCPNLVMSPALI